MDTQLNKGKPQYLHTRLNSKRMFFTSAGWFHLQIRELAY